MREARRLVNQFGVQGFKFHPTMQGFFPNDRLAYPLYEAIQETGKPALFHTGQTGVGSGMRAGNNMRLKYSNPMHLDDVAVDFPDMTIIMAHPSFPWQEEALAVANHKPNVFIDLSGWSPKYFPKFSRPVLQHASQEEGALWFRLADDHSGALVVRLRQDRDQGRGAPAHSQGERGATSQARVTTLGPQVGVTPQTGHPRAGAGQAGLLESAPPTRRPWGAEAGAAKPPERREVRTPVVSFAQRALILPGGHKWQLPGPPDTPAPSSCGGCWLKVGPKAPLLWRGSPGEAHPPLLILLTSHTSIIERGKQGWLAKSVGPERRLRPDAANGRTVCPGITTRSSTTRCGRGWSARGRIQSRRSTSTPCSSSPPRRGPTAANSKASTSFLPIPILRSI